MRASALRSFSPAFGLFVTGEALAHLRDKMLYRGHLRYYRPRPHRVQHGRVLCHTSRMTRSLPGDSPALLVPIVLELSLMELGPRPNCSPRAPSCTPRAEAFWDAYAGLLRGGLM